MSLVSADTYIDFPTDNEFITWFNAQADNIYEEMAKRCEYYAIMNINSHTGNLALSVKAKKSKYADGGWICMASGAGKDEGYHAFIVEFGTQGPRTPNKNEFMKFEIDGKVIFAKIVAPMPAKPFLGPARDQVASEAAMKLRK